MAIIGLGTHLGDFTEETSEKMRNAVLFALKHGIKHLDTALNYRGMKSEKDIGAVLSELARSGEICRGDVFLSTKAGLLPGDITRGLPPKKYFEEVLTPLGLSMDDFHPYHGLLQTLNPILYEHALACSLKNLQTDYVDVHYIHIPEIARADLSEEAFYRELAILFQWYERKVQEGKILSYGLAFEMLMLEPNEEKWFVNLEKVCQIAENVSNRNSHFKYIQIPYNKDENSASEIRTQMYMGKEYSLIDAAHKMNLTVVGSMPFGMGKGLKQYSAAELLAYAMAHLDAVNFGSLNTEHIAEAVINIIPLQTKR